MSRWHAFIESLPTERVSDGNRITHIIDDDEILDVFWEVLDAASERVWMTMYTLEPDEIGRGTLARLTKAARRGCEVLLICDAFGSMNLREEDLKPLRQAGGKAVFFNPFWPPHKKRGALTVRDHRKLLVVDGDCALCGGFNLSEEYAGKTHGLWTFDDTMARIDGPCVHHLAEVFSRTWQEVTGQHCTPLPSGERFADGAPVAVLEIDPRRPETRLAPVLAEAIARAESHCRLVTPYFVPPGWLYDALLEAARRGVDVQVLTAGKTDRAIARLAGWHCYGELLDSGLRVYEMFGRILHSKTLTIDGQFGTIGSYNMDAWTSRHTLDLNVVFADEKAAASLEKEFALGLESAQEVTLADCRRRNFLSRLAHQCVYHAYRRL